MPTEVWANDANLLRVGKRMMTITPDHGGQLSFFIDQARRAELEEFAASFGPY